MPDPEHLSQKYNIALSIAGLDPSGGAGLLADLRSFAAFDVHGLGISAVETVQNSSRVGALWPKPRAQLRQQLDHLLAEFEPGASKLGLSGGAAQLRLISGYVEQGRLGAFIIDPVMVASRGTRLLDGAGQAALLSLLPWTRLLTPNLPELGALSGRPVNTASQVIEAARFLIGNGAQAVLIKGGHGRGRTIVDRLLDGDDLYDFAHPRLAIGKTHGTGCHLSAAITALTARAVPMPDACARAIAWTHQILAAGPDIGPLAVRYLDDSIKPKGRTARRPQPGTSNR